MESYKIINTGLKASTRLARWNHPTHNHAVQHIAGTYRLIRGCPLILTADVVQRHASELEEKRAAGLLAVYTLDGRLVGSLKDLTVVGPAEVEQPPVRFPLDTIARDTPQAGLVFPTMEDGVVGDAKEAEYELPKTLGVVEEKTPSAEEEKSAKKQRRRR